MEKLEIELTQDFIKNNIYIIRGQKVMLDFDLAEIYGYETSKLKEMLTNFQMILCSKLPKMN